MGSTLVNRQAVLLDGAAIGFVFDDVPELQKKPPGPGPFERVPAGFSTPEIGPLEGLWWRVTPFNPEPWKALSPAVEPPENPLLAEFWGPPIPLRATSTMSRPQAVAKEQARQQSIDDTSSIALFPIAKEFHEFYIKTGLAVRAIIAQLPAGPQVRFVQRQLGVVHDNADLKPALIAANHPSVFGDYQMKVVREIAETEDLTLANLRGPDGKEVLDGGGNPIPITWMPTVATKFLEVKADIEGGGH